MRLRMRRYAAGIVGKARGSRWGSRSRGGGGGVDDDGGGGGGGVVVVVEDVLCVVFVGRYEV